MGLVHDDEVPPRPEQALAGVLDDRHPRDRRDDLVAFLPRVLAVVGPEHVAANDVELLAELVRQFALPLEREVGRRDDQHTAHQAAGLQFLEQQPRHDRLAGAGVVRQQEANARQLQEVAVDGFELMRQRIDAGDREREERIVLVGQAETMGLDAQAEQTGVAVEGLTISRNRRAGELSWRQDRVVGQAGIQAAADDLERFAERNGRQDLHRFGERGPADDAARVNLTRNRDGHRSMLAGNGTVTRGDAMPEQASPNTASHGS